MQDEEKSKQDIHDKVEALEKLVLSLQEQLVTNVELVSSLQFEMAELKQSRKSSEQETNLAQESLEPQINAKIDNQPAGEKTEVEIEKNIEGKKDETIDVGRVNSQTRNFMAWLLCGFGMVLTVLSGAFGYLTNHGFAGQMYFWLIFLWIEFFISSIVLPKGLSQRPLYIIILLLPLQMTISLLTCPSDPVPWILGGFRGIPRLLFVGAWFGVWCGMALLGFLLNTELRKDLHLSYQTPKLIDTMSIKWSLSMVSILPVILYFSFQILGAFENERRSNQMYMEHTPWCMYSPTRKPSYIHNIPFTGCDPLLDRRDGLMDIAVWSNDTHPLNRSTAVTLVQKMKANESYYMSFISSSSYNSSALLQHDFERFAARDLYENEVLPKIWPNAIQGSALILSVFFGQIFLHVARLSFVEVVTFKISFWEFIACVNNAIFIATAFMFISLSNEQVGNLMLPLVATGMFTCGNCFVALWRVCIQVSSELKKEKDASSSVFNKRAKPSMMVPAN
eukprot:g3242.t1